MSVLRQVWLMCDICGEESEVVGLTIREARSKARAKGWERDKTMKPKASASDICPDVLLRRPSLGLKPRLAFSELTGRAYILTRYTEKEGGQIIARTKYDVTEDFRHAFDIYYEWKEHQKKMIPMWGDTPLSKSLRDLADQPQNVPLRTFYMHVANVIDSLTPYHAELNVKEGHWVATIHQETDPVKIHAAFAEADTTTEELAHENHLANCSICALNRL